MPHEFPKPRALLITSDALQQVVTAEEVEPLLKSGEYTLVKQFWPSYAWPGGYPLFYTSQDGGCLCPKCERKLSRHAGRRPSVASDRR